MRRPIAVLLTTACAGLFAACGSDDEPSKTNAAGSARSTDSRTTGRTADRPRTPRPPERPTCRRVRAPRPRPEPNLSTPTRRLDPARKYAVRVATSCGEFDIQLDTKRAPKTTASFVQLVEDGFYDRTIFHRVSPGFVIQGGDPTQGDNGGPGYQVDEPPPADTTYARGVVAMAKGEFDAAGVSGSQFFVVVGENASLDPIYAVLGKVTKGMDVVDQISLIPVTNEEKPLQPIVVQKATVLRG